MNMKNLFGAMVLAISSVMFFTSCDKSPKNDEQPAAAPSQSATFKVAYVEVDSLMTQYEFCKEYSLILEKKSQNIQSTLQQKGNADFPE